MAVVRSLDFNNMEMNLLIKSDVCGECTRTTVLKFFLLVYLLLDFFSTEYPLHRHKTFFGEKISNKHE